MESSSMAPVNSTSIRADESSLDDEVLISVTQSLAKEACVFFQLGKYADCLKVLNQLLQKKADDPKILHNIALAENFQDGFSKPERFMEALYNLKKRSERLAHSSGENAEVVKNGSNDVGDKETNSVPDQVSTVNSSRPISDDELDVSVIMFNIAVTLYHLHEYEKCFTILEQLYQSIEPIDERVARHICLLLLDAALVCHHVSRAGDVINYMERVCGNSLGSQGDAGSFTQQQQSSNQVTKATSIPSNVNVSDLINSDSAPSSNGPESPLSRTLSEETLYESLMSTLDISGAQNLTRQSNEPQRIQLDETLITTRDLRLKVHLYKVWVLLLTRNLKAAKREVKMAMNIARGKDYALALFLKSQLEYAKGNHRKAIKLLMASNNQTETATSTLFYNNLGCIYYQLGKYQTSMTLFHKALSNSSPLRKERPLNMLSYSQDKSKLCLYNCGLVHLASGKPLAAVRCFQKAGPVFFKRPLLWLRIAECCIMASEKNSDINVNVIGQGKWRQLVIDSSNSENVVQVEPNLSMTFAKSCLLNALQLLDNGDDESKRDIPFCPEEMSNSTANLNGGAKESKAGSSSANALLQNSIIEYEGICEKENKMVLQAVLADLAFVYLELGNAARALSAARWLLLVPECSKVYIFLANMYAAEAYCLLNQPKKASEHLFGYVSGENSAELPYSQDDCDVWQTRKTMDFEEPNVNNTPSRDEQLQGSPLFLNPEEARGTLMANIAAMAAIEGDIERAHEAVTFALSKLPNNPEVVLTATYIDLVRGNVPEAILKLKKCSHVRFLRGVSMANGSS